MRTIDTVVERPLIWLKPTAVGARIASTHIVGGQIVTRFVLKETRTTTTTHAPLTPTKEETNFINESCTEVSPEPAQWKQDHPSQYNSTRSTCHQNQCRGNNIIIPSDLNGHQRATKTETGVYFGYDANLVFLVP